jgi:hypothetical protein
MSTFNKFDWSYLILLPFLTVRCVPWLAVRVPMRYVFVSFIIWLLFMLNRGRHATQLPQKANIWFARTVFFLLSFSLLRFIFQLFGHANDCGWEYFSGIVLSMAALLILHLSVTHGRQRELGFLVLWIIGCYICVCISTIRGEWDNENISRLLTGQIGEGDYNKVDAAIMDGIALRNQIYSMALLVVPMFYCFRYVPLLLKLVFSSSAILFVYTVYIVQYSSCLVGLAASGSLLLLNTIGVKAKTLLRVGFLGVSITIFGTFKPQVLNVLSNYLLEISARTEQRLYQENIVEVVNSMSGASDTHLSSRVHLYKSSWRAFLSNPLIGVGIWTWNRGENDTSNKRTRLGGHSGILDIFGSSGLLGILLFIPMVVCFLFYLRAIVPTKAVKRWQFLVIAYMAPCVIYMVVTNRSFKFDDISLTLLFPGMIYLLKEQYLRMPRPTVTGQAI